MDPAYRTVRPAVHPLHAILLGFPIALFSAGLVFDIAYLRTAQMQWSNFAAWMIVGALVFGGLVGVWALVRLAIHWGRDRRSALTYVLVLLAMWVLGLVNAFKHSQDAWSSVGTLGLVLSILTTVLALIAGWIAYSSTAYSNTDYDRASDRGSYARTDAREAAR